MGKESTVIPKTFIFNKIKDTITCSVIVFVHIPELKETAGTLKIHKKVQDIYALKNYGVYEIYLKLHSELSVETRLILCQIHDKP